jgi:hypothetical protein
VPGGQPSEGRPLSHSTRRTDRRRRHRPLRSGRQTSAALLAAGTEDGSPRPRRHPVSKAVPLGPTPCVRLERSLHPSPPLLRALSPGNVQGRGPRVRPDVPVSNSTATRMTPCAARQGRC